MHRGYQPLLFLAAVEAMFDQPGYTVEESEGSVRVCVQVVGSASRNVNITLQLMESTARGMLVSIELTSMKYQFYR